MKKIFVILLLSTLFLTGCQTKNKDALKFKNEYEKLNNKLNDNNKKYPSVKIEKDNPIVYSSYDEIEKLFDDKKTGIVYFGFEQCPWCRNMIPVLLESLKETGIEKLYYLNVLDSRDTKEIKNGKVITTKKGSKGYLKLLKRLDNILTEYELTDENNKTYSTGEKRLYVPTVIMIKKGKIIGYHMNTVDSQTDPYIVLNKKQKKELKSIYNELIHKMLGDLCDESC